MSRALLKRLVKLSPVRKVLQLLPRVPSLYYETFLLPLSEKAVPRPIHFSSEYELRDLSQDRELLERIVAAYHRAKEASTPQARAAMLGEVWGEEGHAWKQAALIRALEEKSCAGVHQVLSRFFVTDAAHGIALGKDVAELFRKQPLQCGLIWLDRLITLAFAVGALPLPNPEDNPTGYQRSLEADADEVIAAIEKHIGMELVFPDICGAFGGSIAGIAFPDYSFLHLLAALNLRQLAPSETPAILEIGGGFGALAYFTLKLMPCHYTIYDLPFASAIQAYFLCRAFPDRRIALCGEPSDSSVDCTLLPAWDLLRQPPAAGVDMAVNQDSLPEIPREVAAGYVQALRSCLRGPFLSVNHESPARSPELFGRTSVSQLVETVGGFRRIQRCPFFLRRGYLQEVYYPVKDQHR